MAAFCLGMALMRPAQAHPHMWIDAQATVQFDDQGRVSAIRHRWQFDEMFVAYTTQGLQRDGKGNFPDGVLARMADEWVSALGEPVSHYFTTAVAQGQRMPFGQARDAAVTWESEEQRLILSFVLPLQQPVSPAAQPVSFDVFDPTYFVAYAFDAPGAVAVADAPDGCQAKYVPPGPLDMETIRRLSMIPADATELPEDLYAVTRKLSHQIEVACASS